jgi:hypothetical protein
MEKGLHREKEKQKNTGENNRNTGNKMHYKAAQLKNRDITCIRENQITK